MFVSWYVQAVSRRMSSAGEGSFFKSGVPAHVIEGPCHYYIGIIDMLQAWNVQKKAERCAKIAFCCANGKGLSAMPPQDYMTRFIAKVNTVVHVRSRDIPLRQCGPSLNYFT